MMYQNGYQPVFPMVTVPMNMANFQLMPYMNMPNMMMNMGMGDTQSNHLYGPKFNEFMSEPAETIFKNFDDYVKDQQGCKFMQARLETETENPAFFEGVHALLIAKFIEYSYDQFANYLCQKFIELADDA